VGPSRQGILAHQGNELIWHGGRVHLRHVADGDLAFGLQPAVERAQAVTVLIGSRKKTA
jgi:hypothetical protein